MIGAFAVLYLERGRRFARAGTGVLLGAIGDTIALGMGVAIEINHPLAARLEQQSPDGSCAVPTS
jgi:hypothetical protein